MATISVFEFIDYKAFLRAWISARPSRGRGEKSKIAEAAGCHSAYISQVLSHDAHLSLEQANAFAEYAGLGAEETRFLLLLLQRSRAGTRGLRKVFEAQIQELLEARTLLRNRLESSRTLGPEEQGTYYSSWLYAAAHMAITLPAFQTRDAVARFLAVPPARAADVLAFLARAGLAIEEGGRFRPGTASLYLPENSPLVAKHHGNWRLRAMESLDAPALHDLHYSSVATVSGKDLPKIRAALIAAIEQIRPLIRESKEEDTVFCYSLDLFRV